MTSNVAVVGTGRWGKTIAGALANIPALNLAAIVSRTASDKVASGTPVFDTWDAAVARARIDGIILAVPPDQQPDIACNIIDRGIPLMLEKPLARHTEAATKVLSAAKRSGFVGLVNHLHLYAPEFLELAEQARQHGPAIRIETVSGNRGPARSRWSPLCDWAPHDIAMCLAVVNAPPATVTARPAEHLEENGERFENYLLDLTFPDGATAHIHTGSAFDRLRREFSVTLSDRTLTYSETPEYVRSVTVDIGNGAEEIPMAAASPLTAALQEFARRIEAGIGGIEDVKTGVAVVQVLAAAEESLDTGQPVSMNGDAARQSCASYS